MADSPTTHIKDLAFDPRNARRHTPRNIGMIADSLQHFGANRGIVIDEDGTVLAGNGVLEAAAQAGIEQVRVIESNGSEIIAVKVSHLTPEQKRLYAIADNRTTELSDWNTDVLQSFIDDGLDLEQFWFPEELDALLAGDDLPVPGLTDPDDVPAVPDDPITKPGDLWLLGEHRLLCGDSTVVADVGRLMDGRKADMVFTDPPYNTGIQQGRTASAWGVIENDAQTPEAFARFMDDVAAMVSIHASGDLYVCCDHRSYAVMESAFSKGWGRLRSCIVWAKENFGLGVGYRRQHEFIAYWGKFDGNTESDLWNLSRDRGSDYDHPTQKPVALAERAINNSSRPGDLVLDLFGGSGSTLIAAEQTNRTAYLMDIDPRYVDVTVTRWEQFTGKTATRLDPAHERAAD